MSVFFVISGFLLYRPFAAAHFEGLAPTPMRKFWSRRLRRIVPAYWAAFLVVSYFLHADVVRSGWGSLAIYLGFAQIYSPYHALTGITQAWSLCTEMSFYLMLPLWAAALGRRRRGPDDQLRVELGGLAGLVIASVGYRAWVLQWHNPIAPTMPNWLPAYTDLFAMGMLLAVVSAYLATTDRQPAWLWHPVLPWASWALAAAAFWAVSNIGLPITPLTAFSGPAQPAPADAVRPLRVLRGHARRLRPPGPGLEPARVAVPPRRSHRRGFLWHLSLARGGPDAVLSLDA